MNKHKHRHTNALTSVLLEMDKQDEEWGPQRDYEDTTWRAIMGEEVGEVDTELLQIALKWDNASRENLRKELVQTIAAGLQWLESIDRGIQDG